MRIQTGVVNTNRLAVAAALLMAIHAVWGAATPAAIDLPFSENFPSPTLDPAWAVEVEPGNSIQAKPGQIEFRAIPGSKAQIQRPLGRKTFRASCQIRYRQPAAPVALRLFWDASNYAQIGLNNEGRLCVREALATYPHDYDLGQFGTGSDAARDWHAVAIELAENCIRYLVSDDGINFECRHVSRRPERYAEAPKSLALGQESGMKLFPPGNPWIQPPASGPAGSCKVRNVQVSALPPKALEASRSERDTILHNESDSAGLRELSRRTDPSFESVCTNFPALKWPREVVGVKDNPVGIGVAADGSIQFGPEIANYKKAVAFFEIDGYRFGSLSNACSKRLLNDYMPVVVCGDRRDGLGLEETVFGYSKGFSPDETVYAYARLQAENSGSSARTVAIALKAGPDATRTVLSWSMEVPAGSRSSVEVRLPSNRLEIPGARAKAKESHVGQIFTNFAQPPEKLAGNEFDATLARTTNYWADLITRGSRFDIPEARVQNAYRAWMAYNFLNVSKRGDVYHVCDGSGFYSKIYGYSAALYGNNMDLLGYHDLAAQYLESLLTFVQTNGLLAVNFGSTDTGAALWAMSEHYWITRDAQWLRRMAPTMIQMCGWIIEQRRLLNENPDKDPRTRGLIRYKPYADLLHPAADYFSNAYLQKGLGSAAAALIHIGMQEEGLRLKKESDAYRKDILNSMRISVFKDDGMKILPAIPDSHELWKEANESANGYYGIIVPMMLEAGLPPANGPYARLLVNALETRGGLVAGVCRFHNMADHAYAYGYWIDCLERNEVRKAILGLYGSMAFGMSRDTFAAVECTHIQTGENYWTLPHTYSNTQQLRLLRNMLLREDGRNLWLAQATPRPWLEPGKHVAVKEAPTKFGPVSYSIESRDDGTFRVRVTPPTRNIPDQIILQIRHPELMKIAGIKGARPRGLKISGEQLRFSPGKEPVEMVVVFK